MAFAPAPTTSSRRRSTLTSRVDDSRRAASELQALVAGLGGKADAGGSASGAAHRGWVNVKAMLTGDSDVAALNECERGEDAALERYRDAIKADLPADIAEVVRRQYEGAKKNHDQIRTLRDAARAAK